MTSEQRPLLAASSGTFAADDNPLLGEVAVGSLPSTAEAGIRGARDAASASRLFATPADRLLVAVTNLGLAAFGWLVLTAATSDGLVLFSWHPIGQVVFISAVTNAVALVQSAPPAARKQAAALHWKLQLLGLAGAAIGGAAIYFNKGNRPHLTSWHAIVGAATASAAVLAAIGGALVRWSPALFRTALGRVRALNAHRTAGLFVQLGIAATLSLMILDHFAATQFSDLGRFALTVSWVALNATLWRRLARLVIGWGSSI